MDIYSVSFFGHRIVENPLEIDQRVQSLVSRLLLQKDFVEFLVGRDGEFDQIVSSAIRRCKRILRDDNSAHVWVLPYETAKYRENEQAFRDYYDEIEICHSSSAGHFKAAYQVRNREMVDRSDLIVFYVQHSSGGAYQTMRYAQKREKHIINLHDTEGNGYE